MTTIQILIGKRIREYRLYRGYSIDELASKANLNAAHLSAIERGEKNPTLLTLSKIINVLDFTFQDLLDVARTPEEIASDYGEKILPLFAKLTKKEQELVHTLVKAFVENQE